MNTIVSATNELADKSDRWLFIGVLVVLGFFTWLVLQHLLNQSKGMVAQLREEQTAHEEKLEKIIGKQSEQHDKFLVSYDRNTAALNENTTELKRCREARG